MRGPVSARSPEPRFPIPHLAALVLLLVGCAAAPPDPPEHGTAIAKVLQRASSVELVLLGERHDAPDHPAIHAQVVAGLAARRQLAGLVIEMAERGTSTLGLGPGVDAATVRQRLAWDERAWPWDRYGPAIMAAVGAGVVVAGGNLAREQMRPTMADTSLDLRLPDSELARQRDAIREGHCGLLPDSQIVPMTRIQLARDISMAQTLAELAQPGRVVVLLAGAAHVERASGVPAHLPAGVRALAVLLEPRHGGARGRYDQTLVTAAYDPAVDECADLRRRFAPIPRSP